jgi:hypothetical protein
MEDEIKNRILIHSATFFAHLFYDDNLADKSQTLLFCDSELGLE